MLVMSMSFSPLVDNLFLALCVDSDKSNPECDGPTDTPSYRDARTHLKTVADIILSPHCGIDLLISTHEAKNKLSANGLKLIDMTNRTQVHESYTKLASLVAFFTCK